jgi:serine protease Do
LGAASVLIAFCFVPPALAQDKLPTVERAKDAMKEAVQRLAVPRSLMRDGPHVRSAFREVVAGPRQYTVRVKSNGADTALGCVVGPNGWIITKASRLHDDLSCRLSDGREFEAELVGVDKDDDLAMLKIDATGLATVEWAETKSPNLGQWVATPGLDKDPVAIGVLSVVEREIAKRSGILGVMLEEGDGGPKIVQVVPDSGAAKAGMQVNDVVTHCNGLRTKNRQVLVNTVRKYAPGEEIKLKVKRDGKEMTIAATLADAIKGQKPNRRDMQDSMGSRLSDRRYGFPAVLQHDTVLRPEDCGGAIVDLDGHALGVNVARAGRTASYAVPAHAVQMLLADLMSGKLAPAGAVQSADDESEPSPLPKTGSPPEPE